MGQRGVKIKCFACDLELLGGEHRAERAHVVQAVGYFDENHADVIAHREQQFAEILRLRGGLLAKYAA